MSFSGFSNAVSVFECMSMSTSWMIYQYFKRHSLYSSGSYRECKTLKKKDLVFWNIGKYTVSLPLNQHCFFCRTWFLIFCWLDPILQDPVPLFCYGGPCKVYCFLSFISCPKLKSLTAVLVIIMLSKLCWTDSERSNCHAVWYRVFGVWGELG